MAALGTALVKEVAREADTALETARAEAAALRTALAPGDQRAARGARSGRDDSSRLKHQLTEQRQQSEREWSEGTALLRAQLELKWRSHLAREIA